MPLALSECLDVDLKPLDNRCAAAASTVTGTGVYGNLTE